MLFDKEKSFRVNLYYRLVSLWVISEGLAGGIIHSLHIPLSGMFLSGFAVLCICLIGYYTGFINSAPSQQRLSSQITRGAIIKAAVIVCVFKMMLSPNTPPTAYFAVLFQGFVGQILFINLKHFKTSCILLGLLALVESALQRILVLTLLYGVDFWHALNEFITKLTNQKSVTNYALLLAIAYILIHAVVGVLIGVWASRIITKSQSWQVNHKDLLIAPLNDEEAQPIPSAAPKKRKLLKGIFIFIWIFLLLMFLQSFLKLGSPILPSDKILKIMLRSLFIFLTWYLLISPLLSKWIKKKLKLQQQKSSTDISRILLLIPSIEHIFRKSWQLSSPISRLPRLKLFCKIVLINILRDS